MVDVRATRSEGNGKTDRNEVGAQIRQVFEQQRARRWELAATSATERVAKLARLRTAILARKDELRQALHQDFRKPAAEVDLTELQPVVFEIAHTIKHLHKWMKPVAVGGPPTMIGTQSMIRYEPKGTVLLLAPWNYPFHLLMAPLVAAVAAGNTVMARPSDKVPMTGRFIKSLLEQVFPSDELAVFTGPSWIANTMLELPFDHVIFTGSTRIGKQVMASAASHLASVTLELGGQSPVVVDATADIDSAAERIVWGKFLNAGQTCVAPNHVFVHESVATRFVDAAKRCVERAYGPTEPSRRASEDFCRIVDQNTVRKLSGLVEQSVSAGAKLELGGVSDVEERYLSPTILSGVTDSSPIMEAEIFGPILPVLPYRSTDEVLASIRRRGKPLAMYIFSSDERAIERLLGGTSAGGTVVNNVIVHLANPELPFGGVGESGTGRYHGVHGFKEFSHERAVLVQRHPTIARLFYPPYVPRVRRAIDVMTKLFGSERLW